MILAVSRFRVTNGLEAAVKAAFAARPRLVESAPGFLGMETFTDSEDPTIFVLVTRWADEDSFRRWHASAEHHLSHAAIPKGLKLDPASTELRVLERIAEPVAAASFEELVRDAPALLARLLREGSSCHLFVAALDGTIQVANDTARRALGRGDDLVGRPLSEHLVERDRALLGERVARGARGDDARFLLNFLGADAAPFTLDVLLHVGRDAFVLLGSPLVREERKLLHELLRVMQELSVLAREKARLARDLEAANEDLERFQTRMRSMREPLPVCGKCGRACSSCEAEAAP